MMLMLLMLLKTRLEALRLLKVQRAHLHLKPQIATNTQNGAHPPPASPRPRAALGEGARMNLYFDFQGGFRGQG